MHEVLIGGSGKWAEALTQWLEAEKTSVVRSPSAVEMKAAIASHRPAVAVLGPPFSDEEIVHGFVRARDESPETRVIVAVDRNDVEFAADLRAIGVPQMILVPSGLPTLIEETVRAAGTSSTEWEEDWFNEGPEPQAPAETAALS